jgi:hypothetical protein
MSDHNKMKKSTNLTLLMAALPVFISACSETQKTDNAKVFEPLQKSVAIGALPADAPFAIPTGFNQQVIVDEKTLDIYRGVADWPDMMTTNETKGEKGRYLYRAHEVRPKVFNNDLAAFQLAGGGALSVVDLKTGKASLLVQRNDWEAVDGLVWTPWHTLLFDEEAIQAQLPDPELNGSVSGHVYEVFLSDNDPTVAKAVAVRPQLGSLSHEGIEVDGQGNVYVIDEYQQGSIYKFVPTKYGDLSSGQLYALKVNEQADKPKGTGPAEWVKLDMVQVQKDARKAAAMVGATYYGRPEDLERIGDNLYVALTSEQRVLFISLGDTTEVKEFVKAGINTPIEAKDKTGFKSPDNLANGPDGKLWIVEDNTPSDIWVASPDTNGDGYADQVALFASLSTPGAEATGIYFGLDNTLYVNVQHSDDNNDKTIAITKQK